MPYAELIYTLSAITSFAAAFLLWQNFRKTGFRLLFWSAICFVGLTVNNVMLFADLILFPMADLSVVRTLPAVLGFGALIFGFVWETT